MPPGWRGALKEGLLPVAVGGSAIDIAPSDGQKKPVTAFESDAKPELYLLLVLTDQWEWEEEVVAATLDEAKDAARATLARVVRDETPELASITLAQGDVKMGVWDWIDGAPYWSPLPPP
jgi:hypothetical protein